MNGISLSDYLDQNDFKCPVCLDVYDKINNNKKPALLSCQQHNICIECITSRWKDLKNQCPTCREPITFDAKRGPVVNRAILQGMELATELWKMKFSPKEDAAQTKPEQPAEPVQPMQSVQPLQPFVPANFSVISLEEKERLYKGGAVESLFRSCSVEVDKQMMSGMLDRFPLFPEAFFLYAINNQLQGYVHFGYSVIGCNVISCGLLPESKECADHFIETFREWVKKQPVFSNAIKVNIFWPKSTKSSFLSQAIERYQARG